MRTKDWLGLIFISPFAIVALFFMYSTLSMEINHGSYQEYNVVEIGNETKLCLIYTFESGTKLSCLDKTNYYSVTNLKELGTKQVWIPYPPVDDKG